MSRPIRILLRLGADRRASLGPTWPLLALFLVTTASGVALAAVLAPSSPLAATLTETPVPSGGWALPWSHRMEAPEVEQLQRLDAWRTTAAGGTALLALLALALVVAVWLERVRTLQEEMAVHRAVGARPGQVVLRLVGEMLPWAVAGVGVSGLVAWTLPAALGWHFPGVVEGPMPVGASLTLAAGILVALLHHERRWVFRSRSRPGILARLLTSPVSVAGLACAVLTSTGLVVLHGSAAPASAGVQAWTVPARLSAPDPEARVLAAGLWTGAEQAPWPRGLASAGTVGGTGHRDLVWVDCGRCFEGAMFVPFRTVEAEVHAVSADTFQALGLPVEAGRGVDPEADVGALSVAWVGRSLATRHFEGGQAVGRRIRIGYSNWIEVVGVVPDRPDGVGPGAWEVFVPLAQAGPSEVEAVTTGPAAAQDLAGYQGPDVRIGAARSPREARPVNRWGRLLLVGLGAAATGLFGLGVGRTERSRQRRTRLEVGLRKALGARRRALAAFWLGSLLRRVGLAALLGGWLSLFVGAALQQADGSIPSFDLRVWGAVALLMALSAAVGSWPSFARAAAATPHHALASPD